MENAVTKSRLWSGPYLVFLLSIVFASVTDSTLINVLPVYMQDMVGSNLATGWMITGLTVASMVTRLVCGPLTDRFGRKRLVVIGSSAYALNALAYCFAPNIETIFFLRVLNGVTQGIYFPVPPMLVADLVPEVCLELCRRAGISFEAIHNLTTADAPETIYHVKKTFHRLELEGIKCRIQHPRYKGAPTAMWKLIPQKMVPPTRKMRYCCAVTKEGNSPSRCILLGVRKYESVNRADSAVAEIPGRSRATRTTFDFDNGDERIIAPCQMKATIKIHPIVDWRDGDVWQFLRDAKVEITPCYSMGFRRVGCVGCPMAGKSRYTEFHQWPKFENLCRKAFARMVEARRAIGKDGPWQTADDVWRW